MGQASSRWKNVKNCKVSTAISERLCGRYLVWFRVGTKRLLACVCAFGVPGLTKPPLGGFTRSDRVSQLLTRFFKRPNKFPIACFFFRDRFVCNAGVSAGIFPCLVQAFPCLKCLALTSLTHARTANGAWMMQFPCVSTSLEQTTCELVCGKLTFVANHPCPGFSFHTKLVARQGDKIPP